MGSGGRVRTVAKLSTAENTTTIPNSPQTTALSVPTLAAVLKCRKRIKKHALRGGSK